MHVSVILSVVLLQAIYVSAGVSLSAYFRKKTRYGFSLDRDAMLIGSSDPLYCDVLSVRARLVENGAKVRTRKNTRCPTRS